MTKRKKSSTTQKPKSEPKKITMQKPMCMIEGTAIKVGKVYKIRHRKKGEFVVQILEIVPTEEEDKADDFLLFCRYDVRAGTSQVGLSLAPGKMNVRESALRPSHILSIEDLIGESWKQQVDWPLAEVQKEKGGPGFFTQITNLIKGGN